MGQRPSRIYNIVSIIFLAMTVLVAILVIARLLGPA
jgi:hypothetical protein